MQISLQNLRRSANRISDRRIYGASTCTLRGIQCRELCAFVLTMLKCGALNGILVETELEWEKNHDFSFDWVVFYCAHAMGGRVRQNRQAVSRRGIDSEMFGEFHFLGTSSRISGFRWALMLNHAIDQLRLTAHTKENEDWIMQR